MTTSKCSHDKHKWCLNCFDFEKLGETDAGWLAWMNMNEQKQNAFIALSEHVRGRRDLTKTQMMGYIGSACDASNNIEFLAKVEEMKREIKRREDERKKR